MELDDSCTQYKSTIMSTLHTLFSTTTVKRQLISGMQRGERVDEDEKWAEKAVEILVKKLRWKPGALVTLQNALSDPTARPGDCVTIPRSNDGRMQIYQRKTQPHVTYCRLWRWADLRSQHELEALPCCEFSFKANRGDEVCVNPYHYRRREAPRLADVRIARRSDCQLRRPGEDEAIMRAECPASPGAYDDILSFLDEAVGTSEHATPIATAAEYHLQGVQNSEYRASATVDHRPQPTQISDPIAPLDIANSEAIPYREPSSWATIAYYEFNSRVGQLFQCTQTVVRVDGYTNPLREGDRFCLGSLSNVNRNASIERVRQYIGDGVTLHYAGGELFAECTSAKPIFVQSRICNCQNGYDPAGVIKVEAGMTLKIFDTTFFGNILKRVVGQGYEAVYELIKMCTIRMSFVKGWGADYHRVDVTTTPCWIEITLNGPLKWLDNVLVEMGNPANAITSVS